MRALAVAAIHIAFVAAACREPPGVAFACACAVLTDFDDTSRQATRVCGPSAERAAVIARSCAQREGAPAPVQACACKPEPGGAACRVGECLPAAR